jgi:hypothetical protein
MRIKTLLAAVVAASLFAGPALAGACKEYVTITPDNAPVFGPVVKSVIVGSTVGKEGWDGQGGQCTKPGSSVIWVGPRDANGVCMTPASIVGTVAGPVFAPKTFIEVVANNGPVPDIIEHRNGFNSPVAIPKLGVVKGFNPWPGNAGAIQPGACS